MGNYYVRSLDGLEANQDTLCHPVRKRGTQQNGDVVRLDSPSDSVRRPHQIISSVKYKIFYHRTATLSQLNYHGVDSKD